MIFFAIAPRKVPSGKSTAMTYIILPQHTFKYPSPYQLAPFFVANLHIGKILCYYDCDYKMPEEWAVLDGFSTQGVSFYAEPQCFYESWHKNYL